MPNEHLVEIQELTKVYPGTVAVDRVSFSVRRGEIHAIVGENGAGKSTLIKILAGAVQPTSGTILFDGERVRENTPTAAIRRGISVIYQEYNLVPNMSIAENIFLGRKFGNGIFVNYRETNRLAAELLHEWNIDLDPRANLSSLSIAKQQIVEIIKAVSQDVRLLIMDEPTAALTFDEVSTLFRVTRRLSERGVTIIYISHRLEEIFELCDRVTILRDGQYIATRNVADTNKSELIRMMVGREIGQYPAKQPPSSDVMLSVRGLSDGKAFEDVSFELHRGEILGVYALIGAGRTDVALTLFGAKKRKTGLVHLKGQLCDIHSPADAVRLGIGLVPEDRKGQGLVMSMLSSANMSLSRIRQLSARTFVRSRAERDLVQFYRDKLQMQAHVTGQEARTLSGGTQQKVVLAKMLACDADVILFDEPTRGIDVGAKNEIYELMVQLCDEGKAILMISSEMLELLGMSDRILVMREGRLNGEFKRGQVTEEQILIAASKTTVRE